MKADCVSTKPIGPEDPSHVAYSNLTSRHATSFVLFTIRISCFVAVVAVASSVASVSPARKMYSIVTAARS